MNIEIVFGGEWDFLKFVNMYIGLFFYICIGLSGI